MSNRHVALQGASNFRDFGGYPTEAGRAVKWRRLYRSDHLSELTAADFERLAEHGVRLVCDLRRDSEAEAKPTRWPGPGAPVLARTPLFNDADGLNTFQRIDGDEDARNDPAASRAVMRELYLRLVTEPGPLAALRGIFERLAEAETAFPVLFHCAAGKDRTGVVCALVLGALGVARAHIVEDFMLTQQLYDASAARRERISQIIESTQFRSWSAAALRPIFSAEPEYIEVALNEVEAAGGVVTFLTGRAGVSPQVLERLQGALLE